MAIRVLEYFPLEGKNRMFGCNNDDFGDVDELPIEVNHKRIVFELPKSAFWKLYYSISTRFE